MYKGSSPTYSIHHHNIYTLNILQIYEMAYPYLEYFLQKYAPNRRDLQNFPPSPNYVATRAALPDENLGKTTLKQDLQDPFPLHQTIILKWAMPFVYSAGRRIPCSPRRQHVENQVLNDFHTDGPLHGLTGDGKVLVPHPLSIDIDNNVLCLSDLGDVPRLFDVLRESYRDPSWVATHLPDLDWEDVGRRLGSFFAKLHSKWILEVFGGEETARRVFPVPDTSDAKVIDLIKPIEEILSRNGHKDAHALFLRVQEDSLRAELPGELCFTMGTPLSRSILIDMRAVTLKVGLLDWDFTGLAHGVNGDMAEIFADLQLHIMMIEEKPELDSIRLSLWSMIHALQNAYLTQSRDQKDAWTLKPLQSNDRKPSAYSTLAHFMRTAYIAHGREMIMAAVSNSCD